jgi:Asp-tRNA(Asn)/Glu-tRNA(Gln) amidotransferase A subunit family amidase
MTRWQRLGISGLAQGYLSGRLTPSAVLDDALTGIAAVDAVKELFDVVHLPAIYGSHALAGAVASADAEVVRRLRRAGAVIVGLTRSHEFGWGITTQHPSGAGTRNPRHPDFISGGSSGGSAAAVAAGLVPAAVADPASEHSRARS